MAVERAWIEMDDGIRLSVNLHVPDPQRHPAPWATLLEALPYRKDDLLPHADDYERLRDEGGFVVCRVDLRGTGSSEGVATDEYPASELTDLATVIEWLASRPWSNGNVGMFGWSYSGFNSLQVACERPPALRAICAIYATDDRYTDDVHYMGGAVRAVDLVDYCHYMTACNALPPVPAVFGDGWRDEWHRRVDALEPWLLRWMREQTDGPYWRHGSVRPDYGRIECATMLVAGWADGYRNNTLRTQQALRCPTELLVGPWSHMDTATSLPGPHLDLVPEMVRFFGRWLRDEPEPEWGVPRIRVFVRHPTPPEPDLALHRGEWHALDDWTTRPCVYLPPEGSGTVALALRADVGTAAWNSCAGGLPWGQPLDQREDDAWSLTFDWPVGDEAVEILGHPSVTGRFGSDADVAYVSVKLCNVFPDGTSALVTRGLLNLTHRSSSVEPEPLTVGELHDATIELEAAAWRFPPGHTIRLSIAGTDWPNTWVPPAASVLTVDSASLRLQLPVDTSIRRDDAHIVQIPAPAPDLVPHRPTSDSVAEHDPSEDDRGPSDDDRHLAPVWRLTRDILGRTTTATTSYGSAGPIEHHGTMREHYDGEVGVSLREPSKAWALATTRYELTWPEVACVAEARLEVRSDETCYDVTIELDVDCDGERFARRTWHERIPRRLN
jgi:uncharacterized protein